MLTLNFVNNDVFDQWKTAEGFGSYNYIRYLSNDFNTGKNETNFADNFINIYVRTFFFLHFNNNKFKKVQVLGHPWPSG